MGGFQAKRIDGFNPSPLGPIEKNQIFPPRLAEAPVADRTGLRRF